MATRIFRRLGLAGAALAVLMLGFVVAPAMAQSMPGFPSGGLGGGVSVGPNGPVRHALPRLNTRTLQYYNQHPAAWQQFLARMPVIADHPQPSERPPASSGWQLLTHNAGVGSLDNPLLLSDGTVIMQKLCTTNWYKLTPDITGSYVNGTWSQIASMPAGYAPLFFGSAVLSDGRVIAEGGEYNSCNAVWTNLGAIYDPVANSWTAVSPPSGWTNIGDAQGVVLPNLTYMQADCCHIVFQGGSPNAALFNESSLTWPTILNGAGKFDDYDEEGWTLLPNGNVLTVDAYTSTGTCGTNSEIFNTSTLTWATAGSVINQLADCNSTSENGGPSYEMGPQVLRPTGTVVAFGATTNTSGANAVAHTSIFNTSNSTWATGPNIPTISGQNYNLADAPAALEPSATILFEASPGLFSTPTHFFEFSTSNTITQVADTSDASTTPGFEWMFLVLPTGQILATPSQTGTGNVWIYTPTGGANSSWAPVISSLSSTTLAPGGTYQVAGIQLNGLSNGANYGDDVQGATNYPIVQITNNSTSHVFYARTSGWSNGSIAPSNSSTANFKLPPSGSIETGASSLVVIANGIPSAPAAVTVGTTTNYTLAVSELGPGSVTSSPAGISCPGTCSASFASGTTVSLHETPASNWLFLEWDGACLGVGGCSVTMTANENVMATFWLAESE